MKTITVAALIQALQSMPQGDEVRVWLPGSTIALSSVFKYKGAVRIEGNVDQGSALDELISSAVPAPRDTESSPDNAYLDRFPPDQRDTADRAYQDGFTDCGNSMEGAAGKLREAIDAWPQFDDTSGSPGAEVNGGDRRASLASTVASCSGLSLCAISDPYQHQRPAH